MAKFLNIKDAAAFLSVSQDTLRKWDKAGKLKPVKTAGGHRRYDIEVLNEFVGFNNSQLNYGDLYEHLCSAQYIADELRDSHADQLMRIRQEIGDKLLSIHKERAKVQG